MKKQASELNYTELREELTVLTAKLEEGELSIDDAVTSYERGLEIISQLETYLKHAEHRVQELRAQTEAAGDS